MKLEIGKEYYHIERKVKCKLIYISETDSTACLTVHKDTEGYECVGWVPNDCLKELSPYNDFKRGEPVMVRDDVEDKELRRYFSHMGHTGLLFCFEDGGTAWSSELECDLWKHVRKLTPEEQKEYDECK